MSAGTLTLTNNSAAVTGSGTAFTTELAAGDFIVVTVGGIPYTLAIKTVNSNTSLTLISSYTGPTQAGAAWYAVPCVAMNLVTAALVAQSAEALRGLNYDKQNWQSIFSGTGNVTVTLPDGSRFTGPAWNSFTQALNGKADKVNEAVPINQGGTGATTAEGSRTNLGLGSSATRNALSTTGDILSVGDYGIGSTTGNSFNDFTATQTIFSNSGGPVAANFLGFTIKAAAGDYALQLSGRSGQNFYWRGRDPGSTSTWRRIWDDGNTTVDTSGYIKRASPVVKLFADGSYETNEESEGVFVTRIAEGQYRIDGCMGINSDAAWGGIDGGFDIPTDRNKQPLVWLDYEVNADGSVLVKTYHRTHPEAPAFARNELQGIHDGDPVDIPSDQFISVRVEMPENSVWNQSQKEAAEPAS